MADEIYVCKKYEESKIVNCTTYVAPRRRQQHLAMRKAPFLTDDCGVRSDAADETAEDANLKYESDEAHCSVFTSSAFTRIDGMTEQMASCIATLYIIDHACMQR